MGPIITVRLLVHTQPQTGRARGGVRVFQQSLFPKPAAGRRFPTLDLNVHAINVILKIWFVKSSQTHTVPQALAELGSRPWTGRVLPGVGENTRDGALVMNSA